MKSLTTITEILQKWPDLQQALTQIFSDTGKNKTIEGIQGSFFSYFASELCKKNKAERLHSVQYSLTSKSTPVYRTFSGDIFIIAPTENDITGIFNDLSVVYPEAEINIFPNWGTVPYRPAARGSVIFGKRCGTLAKLTQAQNSTTFSEKPVIFLITQRAFLSPLPPPEYIKKQCFTLNKGSKIDTVKIAEKLTQSGYTRVPKVSTKGEFSLRGEVLDIFLPNDQNATRIIFDFDTITDFREFETETQVTTGKKESILIYPMKEVIWTEELIQNLRQKLNDYQRTAVTSSNFENSKTENEKEIHLPFTEQALLEKDKLISSLETTKEAEGEEFFYSLLWDKTYSFKDYIPENAFTLFYDHNRLENAQLVIDREYNGLYRKTREEFPVLPPDYLIQNVNKLTESLSNCIFFKTVLTEQDDSSALISLKNEPPRSFFGNINFLKEELKRLLADDWNIFIFADNENQLLRINEIFKDFTNAETNSNPVTLIPQAISSGFGIGEQKLLVIQENEIFGRRKYIPKTLSKAKSKAIDTFVELTPGDYVVHVSWGIGRFHGIERVKTMGNERDYIKLEYADKEFAFVPIEQVNLVQRYIGNEGENPRLDRIGSKAWENRKNKVRQSVEELAEKLISLYSRRKASRGFAFPKENEWQAAFEASFPYEDTPDQITVTEEVKKDMERDVPMDRLVCGDVGYGKTEIAMRAAFKAVMGGKQVAFLAPTTILAEQHYENCKERFKNFPVKIEHMSRFVSASEQKKILSRIATGEADILIGTHRIIQKDVKFKNLGLMIIDEEQRFGVKDKEKLKEMKNNIDCLTMSATPIPRTLHMSLLKIRDMSLLTTPPQNRQPIETVIDEYNDDRVAKAIRQEIERGGQVFYLHNRVESLLETKRKIEQIVPEVLVDVANGQMSSTELDDIFRRFKLGGFHVLIATTIIENGIDIPNVNTIIIDRADMYGVSQLYQLRGRVGRSDRKAYAYLLYPENKALSEIAMKRLQVISDFTELGSGFKIAMKDMEIRGAGNLLGRDQSGDVYSVGFDMYVRLLNEAVSRLSEKKDYQPQTEVLLELEYTGFIPDTYIINPQIKMQIYKKIAAVTDDTEFDAVLSELSDRFGPIPDEVSSLLAIAEIRILCRKLGIVSIKEKQGEARVEFGQVSKLSVDKVLKMIKENNGVIRLDATMPNYIFIKIGKIGLKEKSEFIREKLSKLA